MNFIFFHILFPPAVSTMRGHTLYLNLLHLRLPLGRAQVPHLPQVVVAGRVDLHQDVLVPAVQLVHVGEVLLELGGKVLQAV